MIQSLPVIPTDTSLYLDPQVTKKLQTQEDYENYYLQLEKVSVVTSWWKADLLLKLRELFGKDSLGDLAKRINAQQGTLGNYIRVARAFPPEKRIPHLSFSHHFNSSFADEYNEESNTFSGEERFAYLTKSLENAWSTRHLKAEIDRDKKKKKLNVEIIPCTFCELTNGEIKTYKIWCTDLFPYTPADTFESHSDCYAEFKRDTLYGH